MKHPASNPTLADVACGCWEMVPADSSRSPRMVEENLLVGEETYLIRGGLFMVQNEVGLGRDDELYHQALKIWLADKGIPYRSKPAHDLLINGKTIHKLYPDFVLWDKE